MYTLCRPAELPSLPSPPLSTLLLLHSDQKEHLAGVAIQQMGLEPRHIRPREHCITMLAAVLHLPWLTLALLPSHILFLHPDFLIFGLPS